MFQASVENMYPRNRNAQVGAERLAAAPYLRATVPGLDQVVLVKPTAVTVGLTGGSQEYAAFWEVLYGNPWIPSATLPAWADAVGRMRLLTKGNAFHPGGTVHVERVPYVGVLVYLWVDGHPSITNDWADSHGVPRSCAGSLEVSDALLFAAALGRWKREPMYIIKGVVERSMGGGATFYPPVWISPWQTRDALPLYLCDFEKRRNSDTLGKAMSPVMHSFGLVEQVPRVPRTHRLQPKTIWARPAYHWGAGEVDRWVPRPGVDLPLPPVLPSPARAPSVSDGGWCDVPSEAPPAQPMETEQPQDDTDATVTID